MKFFFENSGLSEIVVRNPHDDDRNLPAPIASLFRSDNGSWSLLPITRLLPQVTSICLTDIDHSDIEANGESYIQCITELQNVRHFQNADNSRIEFRTKMDRDARKLETITALIDEHKKSIKKNGWTLEYDECGGLSYHRIVSRRMNVVVQNKSVPLEDELESHWIWKHESAEIAVTDNECMKAFELSLDAEPEVLDHIRSSDDQKHDENIELEFSRLAIMSVIGEDVVDEHSLRVIIDGIKDDGILIAYQLIAKDVGIMTEALKQIESRKNGMDNITFAKREFPVISNVMIDDISLSEMFMRDELEQKRKETEDAQRDAKVNRMKDVIEKERLQMEEERKRFKEKMQFAIGELKKSESQIINELQQELWEQKQKNVEKETILRKRAERLETERLKTEQMRTELKMERLNMETLRASLDEEREKMIILGRELNEKEKEIENREADVSQREEELEEQRAMGQETEAELLENIRAASLRQKADTFTMLSDPDLHSIFTIDDFEKSASPKKPAHRSGPIQIRKNNEKVWSDKKLVLRDGQLMVYEDTVKDRLSENGYLGKVTECKLSAITSENEVMFSMEIESKEQSLEMKSTRKEYKKWSDAMMGAAASPSGPYLTRGPSLASSGNIGIRTSGSIQICDKKTRKWKEKWMVLQEGELVLFKNENKGKEMLKKWRDKGRKLSKLDGYIGMATECMLRELAVFEVVNEMKPPKGSSLEFKCTRDEYKEWCNVLQEV